MKGQMRNPTAAAFGAFDSVGRTAPAATRMEGLLAAFGFVPDKELRAKIRDLVNLGINFLFRAQFVEGLYAGGISQEIVPSTAGAYEIRIDYVQHALCAWLTYRSDGLDQGVAK
jgi:hypothetical protein